VRRQSLKQAIWIAAGILLLVILGGAFWASPFVHSSSAFASFEKSRAIPAGMIGICGTAIILVWGWALLRKRG
jgi:hypothetical protein